MDEWINLGALDESATDFSIYYKDIGVYKATLKGDVVYIGKATELNNGGFRKRLRDYTRTSDSARNYPSGIKMHDNRKEVIIEILLMRRSIAGISDAEQKEKELINLLNPIWNILDTGNNNSNS